MRDIEFRGKRKDGGGWLYGYLTDFDKIRTKDCPVPYSSYFVIPETVGQYTGLTLGKTKVYEGDIILCYSAGRKPDKYRYLVLWEDAGFFTRIITPEGLSPGSWNLWEVQAYVNRKVIGNIYDNPELLEVNNS